MKRLGDYTPQVSKPPKPTALPVATQKQSLVKVKNEILKNNPK